MNNSKIAKFSYKCTSAVIFSPIGSEQSNYTERQNQSEFSFNKTSASKQDDRLQIPKHHYYNYQPSKMRQSYNAEKSDKNIPESYRKSSGYLSLRDQLTYLDKNQVIQILVGEIQENKLYQQQIDVMDEHLRAMSTLRDNKKVSTYQPNFEGENQWEQKYTELTICMEQYIANTNQAQKQFVQIIRSLKSENAAIIKNQEKCRQQTKNIKTIQCESCQSLKSQLIKQKQQFEGTINDLQKSLEHYMEINNQGARKYEKLKVIYQRLNDQMEKANENIYVLTNELKDQISSQSNPNTLSSQISSINQSVSKTIRQGEKSSQKQYSDPNNISYQISHFSDKQNSFNKYSKKGQSSEWPDHQKLKVMEIQNHELRECNALMQNQLQNKSEKIRKLLEDVEKLSEQKWKYKQIFLRMNAENQVPR